MNIDDSPKSLNNNLDIPLVMEIGQSIHDFNDKESAHYLDISHG